MACTACGPHDYSPRRHHRRHDVRAARRPPRCACPLSVARPAANSFVAKRRDFELPSVSGHAEACAPVFRCPATIPHTPGSTWSLTVFLGIAEQVEPLAESSGGPSDFHDGAATVPQRIAPCLGRLAPVFDADVGELSPRRRPRSRQPGTAQRLLEIVVRIRPPRSGHLPADSILETMPPTANGCAATGPRRVRSGLDALLLAISSLPFPGLRREAARDLRHCVRRP